MIKLRKKIENLERLQNLEIPIEYDYLGNQTNPKEEANWVDITISGVTHDDYSKVQRHKINGKIRRISNGRYPPEADLRYL